MRTRTITTRFAIVAGVLALAWTASAQVAKLDTVATFPGDRIENVFQTGDGSLYFTTVFSDRVMRLAPGAAAPSVFFAVHAPQGIVETPTGFVVDYQDRNPDFASGKFDFKNLGPHLAVLDKSGRRVRTIDGLDGEAFYNGMAMFGADSLFVADSGGDRILKVDLKSGKTGVWLDSAHTHEGAAPGAPNGLKVHDGWVYFARGDVYRVKIAPNGEPVGKPVLAAKTGGTDDFDVGADGSVYASHGMDVLAIKPSGEITKAVAGQCQFCTAARVSRDGRTLYVTGGSVPGMPGMPPVPGFLKKADLPQSR